MAGSGPTVCTRPSRPSTPRDGVKIKEETQTLATITLQNYFKLYKKLSGMTGTAMTEADEFWKIYKLEVIAIPTNKPLIRINHPDVIFRTEKEKWKASVEEIVEVNKEGRPILVGTTDVDKSIKLSEMLKRRGIKHELLNALPEHAAREAEIVAQAGRIGAVTIATNMAGRGTDIILGGNPETLAWARLKDKYASRLDVPEDEWKQTVEDIETQGEDEGGGPARSPRWAACTSSAPNATTPAASTTSCAAAPAGRAIPAPAASICRWKTT